MRACTRAMLLLGVAALLPGVGLAQGGLDLGALAHRGATRAGGAARPAGTSQPTEGRAVLRYTPTPALQGQTVRAYVARTKPAATAQAVASTFGPGQVSYAQLYQAILAGSGFQDNDVASALGVYLELGYRVVRDIQADNVVTPSQERGLRAQVARVLGQRGRPATVGAAARLGETLKLQTVVLALGWKQAVQDGQLIAFRNATASQFSARYHLDFQLVQLTEAGFEPRR